MGKIYANAAMVSVWLGDIIADHVPPREVVRERQASNVPGLHNRKIVPQLASFTVDHAVATLDDDTFSQDLALSLPAIASAKYWKRAWIIQEFLLARGIHIYFGDAQIDEAVFRTVLLEQLDLKSDAKLLGHNATAAKVSITESLMTEWPPLIFVTERQLRTRAQMKRPFYDLLTAHAGAECSDPIDIVFSLLSLITREERVMLDRCFPDYSIAYIDIAFVVLAHLRQFAGDRPVQPLLRLLDVPHQLERSDVPLLFHVLRSYDYENSANPAADAWKLRSEGQKASRKPGGLFIEDHTHTSWPTQA